MCTPETIAEQNAAKADIPPVDLDKLETALNAASQRAATQWLGYLSLWAYLFFTTVAVTDYDLLVETPIKLPLIGVELGLFSFFVWAPALFLVVHLYIARKVALLARMMDFYRAQVKAQRVMGNHLRARENQLDAFAVTSLLARFESIGAPAPGPLLRLLTWLTVYATLFLLPVALYAAFQVFFLAYQHEWMTCWHRVALLLGLALAFYSVRGAGGFLTGKLQFALSLGTLALALVIAEASLAVFAFPGELLHRWSAAAQMEEEIRWFPNVLRPKQPERLFTEIKKAGKLGEARQLDLAGRNFSGRSLRGAELSDADLRASNLKYTSLQSADLRFVSLQDADMSGASLQGADLSNASLQGANLTFASLQGAGLFVAHMQGANLTFASLQGANLTFASLQGAILWEANLQSANLRYTRFWRTSILGTKLNAILFRRVEGTLEPPLPAEVNAWLAGVPEGEYKDDIKRQLTSFGDPFDDIAAWAGQQAWLQKVADFATPTHRANVIAESLCNDQSHAHALRSVIHYRLSSDDTSAATLQLAIIDPKKCPAARDLTDADRQRLARAVQWERLAILNREANAWFEAAGLPLR